MYVLAMWSVIPIHACVSKWYSQSFILALHLYHMFTYICIWVQKYYSHISTHVAVCMYSGTYNNQYMVVDLKKVHLNNVLEDDALWVAEQIPG